MTARRWTTARAIPQAHDRVRSRGPANHVLAPEGKFESPFSKIRLVLHGFGDIREATVNDKGSSLQSQVVRMLDPLAALSDVYYDEGTSRACDWPRR